MDAELTLTATKVRVLDNLHQPNLAKNRGILQYTDGVLPDLNHDCSCNC